MFSRTAIFTFSMLIALTAGAALAETAMTPAGAERGGEAGGAPGSIQSAAELIVADEAALGCHREVTAADPNPEPCDVFLRLTANSLAETLRQAAAHNNRGLIMTRLGGLEAALADFEAALALAPALSAAQVNRGTALFHMGLYPDALTAFDNVIDNDEEHRAAALFNRSFVYRALGELDLAAADLATAAQTVLPASRSRGPMPLQAGPAAKPLERPGELEGQSPE
jgi:tetratricopeptide (TPR) repeat protein